MSGLNLKKKVYSNNGGNSDNYRPMRHNALLRMTAERNAEYAVCVLEAPAYGMQIGDKVALKMQPLKEGAPKPKKPRPEIKDFAAGKRIGTSPVFGEEVLIIAENSWIDRKDTVDGMKVVRSRWLKTAIHDMANPGANASAVGFVSVGPVKEFTKSDGTKGHRQNRGIHLDAVASEEGVNPEAFMFSSLDEFKHFATEWLNFVGPNAEIIVRIADHNMIRSGNVPDGGTDIATKSLRVYWDKTRGEKGEYMSVEESIEYFLDGPEKDRDGNPNEDFGEWRGYISQADAADYTFDAIVNRNAPTGPTTLENMLEKRPGQTEFEVNLFNTPVSGDYNERVFLKGALLFRNQPNTDGEGTRIIATDTFAIDDYGPTYTAAELPGGRPEDVQKILDDRATARGEKRYQTAFKKDDKKKDAEDDLQMGGEDPAPQGNSLTPS